MSVNSKVYKLFFCANFERGGGGGSGPRGEDVNHPASTLRTHPWVTTATNGQRNYGQWTVNSAAGRADGWETGRGKG
jgi:hypothetical protein